MKNVFMFTVLCIYAACTTETSKLSAPTVNIVDNTSVTAPGTGTWVCTLAGAGMMSQCVRRTEST